MFLAPLIVILLLIVFNPCKHVIFFVAMVSTDAPTNLLPINLFSLINAHAIGAVSSLLLTHAVPGVAFRAFLVICLVVYFEWSGVVDGYDFNRVFLREDNLV